MPSPFRIALASSLAFLAAAPALAQPRTIPLEPARFDTSEARSALFTETAGRSALCFEGAVFIADAALRAGVLEADIANSGARAFANMIFHAQNAHDFEAAYLRLHKSGQADAVQYTPHMNGETHWQLLGRHQVAAGFGEADWIPMRAAFSEDQLTLSANGTEMQVDRLLLGGDGDRVGFYALNEVCVSNIRLDTAAPELAPAPGAEPLPEGVITAWSLSPSEVFEGFSARAPVIGEWERVESEADGFLYVSRHREKASAGAFESNSTDLVHAAVTIQSDAARRAVLRFDASDRARVWLNGAPLVEIDNSFRAKGPLFRGDIDMQAQQVFLDLDEGENLLVIGVADRANGWGLGARIEPLDGVSVRPAR